MLLSTGLSGCHIYRTYERPELSGVDSLYRVSAMTEDTMSLADFSWKELFTEGRKIFEESDGAQKRFFRGGKITLKELKEYMEAESVSEELETMLLTRSLEEKIIQSDSAEEFWSFVQGNIEKFSSVRERARYYFCKYLYFYIQDRCDRYYESCIREEKLRNQYGNMLEKGERGREEKFAL